MPDGSTGAPVIRVLVADQIAHIVQDIEHLATRADDVVICGMARREADIAAEAAAQQPDVLVLRSGFDGSDPAAVTDAVLAVSPSTRVVLLQDSDAQQQAPVEGVSAVVSADASLDDVLAAVRGVRELEPAGDPAAAAANGHVPGTNVPPAVEAEPIQDVPRRRQRRSTRTRGEVILVFSGKGGVGKSMLATNLAVSLAHETDSRVALVDLNLQFGDVGVMLHVEHHPMAIEDLSQQGEEVEGEFLDQVMAAGPSDVRVLLAPSSPEYADLVTTANLRAILRELGRNYDYIVLDAPSYLEERVLETIEIADEIVLVTTFNITSVKNTKITLNLFSALGVAQDRVAIVLNQNRPKVSFTREEIEEILRVRVMAQLPYDARVDETIDTGRPIVLAEPRSDLAKQIHAIIDYLVTSAEPPEAAPEPARARGRANRRRFSLGRR